MDRCLIFIAAAAAFAALFMPCRAMKGDNLPEVVHVGGKVMCRDCSQDWNHWAKGGTPLKGCRVAVTCMDERRHVVYFAGDETDAQGAFEIAIQTRVDGRKIDPRDCSVRPVSSPHSDCDVAADADAARDGVKLRRPSVVYRDLVRYTVGPFHYTSPTCDEPDTDADADDDDSQ